MATLLGVQTTPWGLEYSIHGAQDGDACIGLGTQTFEWWRGCQAWAGGGKSAAHHHPRHFGPLPLSIFSTPL